MNFIADYIAIALVVILFLFYFDKKTLKYSFTLANKVFIGCLACTALTSLSDLISGYLILTPGSPTWLNILATTSDLTSSYSQIRSSLHNLAIASENLSISTFSYREGQATVLDVLQAQISWIQIYTNAITARFNYAVALSEYMRLTAQQ